jgi:hypothetical protein
MCRGNGICSGKQQETSQTQMMSLVGVTLYGYCGGKFGKFEYGEKVIEAIGRDWIVVRLGGGSPELADFSSFEELLSFIKEFSVEQEDDQ